MTLNRSAHSIAAVLTLHPDPSQAVLDEALQIIRQSGILAVPTDTFYGLGASARDEAAVQRIHAIKGRPEGKPILVLIADQLQLADLVVDVPPTAQRLIDRFWPGPLTLIMRATKNVHDTLTAGSGTIGIRQPAHPALRKLLCHVGPLTGTSANRSGMHPMRMAHEVQAALGSDVDLILDGGPTPGGMPSTVVDTVETIRIVREGVVTIQHLQTCLRESGGSLDYDLAVVNGEKFL